MLHNLAAFFITETQFLAMFSLNKLFRSASTAKTPKNSALIDQLEHELSLYRSDVFPAGLTPLAQVLQCELDESRAQAKLKVVIEIPFAATGEADGISAFLSDKLNIEISLSLTCRLTSENKIHQIKHVILVASGKGGVGKSTTAINLAAALQCEGAQVGVLDADIYGPSIPILLGLEDQKPQAKDDKTMLPLTKHGIKAQSIGFLVPADNAMVWRGPMASGALAQLLNETDWGELDYLIVDMPPGTGDIQLTMSQKVPASGAVIVTTPQDLALADAQKGITMFEKVKVPILGLIENMSHFVCGHCGEPSHVFGQDGGKVMAQRYGVPLLAEIPLQLAIRESSEQGEMIAANTEHEISESYRKAARLMASQVYYQQSSQNPVEISFSED